MQPTVKPAGKRSFFGLGRPKDGDYPQATPMPKPTPIAGPPKT